MKKELSPEKSTFIYRIFRICVLSAAAILTLMRMANLFFFFDAEIGYFQRGAVLPTVYTVLAVLFIAGVIAVSFMIRSNAPAISEYTVSSRCASVFCAFAFALAATNAILSPYSWALSYMGKTESIVFHLITLAFVISPIVSAIYFALYAIKKTTPVYALVGGIASIVYTVITLSVAYFDIMVQMNAPEKLSVHLSCICTMLLLLSEMRVMTGAPKNAFYLASVSLSALFLVSNALPTAVASFAGVFSDGFAELPSVSCYVFLALGIFSIVRLIMADIEKE